MKRKALIVFFAFLVALSIGLTSFLSFLTRPYGHQAMIEVRKGMGLQAVSEELYQAGLTDKPAWMKYYLRYRRVNAALKAGEYEFGPQTTPREIADKFLKGQRLRRSFTIPEGYSIREIAALLDAKGIAMARSFLTKALSPQAARTYDLEGSTLEGYLFPDNYEYTRSTTEEEILERMIQRFKEKIMPPLREKSPALGLSPYQVLILASIIEKETGKEEERALISSVFHNRLKQGVPLATDPTVIYGITNFDGNLRKADLRRDGPYNTYLRPGLPPTPIANPGLKSLQAALEPTPSPYLFFVSRGDGSHHFPKTYEEHQAAVIRYQLSVSPSPERHAPGHESFRE